MINPWDTTHHLLCEQVKSFLFSALHNRLVSFHIYFKWLQNISNDISILWILIEPNNIWNWLVQKMFLRFASKFKVFSVYMGWVSFLWHALWNSIVDWIFSSLRKPTYPSSGKMFIHEIDLKHVWILKIVFGKFFVCYEDMENQ